MNAASYSLDVAPGSLASLFAGDLTYMPNLAQPRAPFPTQWNGTRVLVNGQPAPLLYINGGQINFQIPRGTTSPATVDVSRGGSSSASITISLFPAAPGLFSADGSGRGQGAILHNNTGQLASAQRPARSGDILEIYLTGLNDCEPEELCIQVVPEVVVGGIAAPVLFSGRAPGYPGVNQINIRVPTGIEPGGAVPVRVAHLSRMSNEVTIAVQ